MAQRDNSVPPPPLRFITYQPPGEPGEPPPPLRRASRHWLDNPAYIGKLFSVQVVSDPSYLQ